MMLPLSSLLLALVVSAQSPAPEQAPPADGQRTVEVLVVEADSDEQPSSIDPTVITVALAITDLDVREAFYDGLMADARRSPERCSELMLWLSEVAEGSDELAWTARLALRELQRPLAIDPFLAFSSEPGRLDIGHATDLDAWTVFLAQPSGRHLDASDLEAVQVPGGASLELEAWIERARSQDNRFPVASLEALGDCTLELRIGPTWAQLRLLDAPVLEPASEDDPVGHPHQTWTTRVREFSGRDLAEIVRRNPDLVGVLPFEVHGIVASQPSPRTDVLGVWTQPLTPERCSALGLPPGCGLEVGRVEPGTVAEVLGISPGSVVLEVCGVEVRGNVGIADAMQGVRDHHGAEGEDGMCVVWIDAFGRSHQRTWRCGSNPKPLAPVAPVEEQAPTKLRPVQR